MPHGGQATAPGGQATAPGRQATAPGRRRLLAALAAGALVAGGGAAYLARDGRSGSGARTALPPLEGDPGLVHTHGLGVDPGDGVLYAATHSGLFRVPASGTPVRIANRAQDTMGFSVVGPGTFLGSGHPDFREDDVRPPLLGLIESADRGQTWQPLSLRGAADFHVLRVAYGMVYGFDSTSGTFMVSRDRKAWERRSRLPLGDFVVSPSDSNTVIAATDRGLVRSRDGGRTWQGLPGAPALTVLAWPAAGSLYGVTRDGTVQVSADGGARWAARGTMGGEPEALAVDARDGTETLYAASSSGGLVSSRDGGRTFTTRYRQ